MPKLKPFDTSAFLDDEDVVAEVLDRRARGF